MTDSSHPELQPPIQTQPTGPWVWHITETYKGLVLIAIEALKIIAIINGGAAVACLTYLGSLAASSTSDKLLNIKPALLFYCLGLVAIMFAFITTYLAQIRLYQEERSRHEKIAFKQFYHYFVIITIVLTLLSIWAFARGCFVAVEVFDPAHLINSASYNFSMTCLAKGLNIVGLILNLIGVILLFRFAIPYQLRTGGNKVTFETSLVDINTKKNESTFDKFALLGIACVVLGAILQICAIFIS